MFQMRMTTDANGFVLFAVETLALALGRPAVEGENLLLAFKRTHLGDQVLNVGAIVPIYPITDGTYDVCVRLSTEAKPAFAREAPDARAGTYVLHVARKAVVGDLAILQEWAPEEGWNAVALPAGFYTAEVFAYRAEPCSGFEIVLSVVDALPPVTAEWGTELDVDNSMNDR